MRGLRLKLALRKQDVHAVAVGCETQREVQTGFTLPSLRIWLFLELRILLREPSQASAREQREGGRIQEHVRFGDHGEVRNIARTLIVSDVFGLASLGLRRTDGADVDGNFRAARQDVRIDREQQVESGATESQAHSPADDTKNDALGDQLARQSARTCAQCRADGQLTLA